MRNRLWCAAAVLTFVAAFVPGLAPVAHADTTSDVYAAVFTCSPACAAGELPSAPNGTDFAPGSSFIIDYRGVDFDITSITTDMFSGVLPTDTFTWSAFFQTTGGLQDESFSFTDLVTGTGISYQVFSSPNGLLDSADQGTVTFVDQSTGKPMPEPTSVALLALGLGVVASLALATRRRNASASA